MFNVKDGFDIVIGNPPYIQLQNNGGELGKLYAPCGYHSFASTGDIYCLFYERGWQLLKKSGHLCYITSNKWMRAGYGEKLRSFLSTKTNPQLLIDFGGVKVFESATVDTNILLFEKGANVHKTLCAVTNKQNKDSLKQLSVFVQQQGSYCDFSGGDSWVILSPIEQSIKKKIEAVGTPLKDWDIQINYGIKTGFNDAFIVTTEKRDEILANCSNEDERKRTDALIRPILRGRDIKRYGYEWANLWLINTHNGVKGHLPRIRIEDYPAVKAHLDKYWDKIKDRADQGDTPYNLRNCAYLEDFFKPKIAWARLMRLTRSDIDAFPRFCQVPSGIFTVDSLCFIVGDKLEHFISILNSEYAAYYFFNNVATLDNGGFQMRQQFIENIPIPPAPPRDKDPFDAFDFSPDEKCFIAEYIRLRKEEILDSGR
ncbi:MAG: Eco57I restriction-modification methylase domain-containing protein [Bacteroidales bacterium]|nr:Eco57I restriction-modification methylase domain-containing protein [Bacteroidales bacterium]